MRGRLYPMDGAHPLGETGKRAAERAERAETPCKNPACGIRQRYQSSGVHAAATGLRRSAWRKLAETPCKNFARETVRSFTVSLSGPTPVQNDYRTTGNTGNSPQGYRIWRAPSSRPERPSNTSG